MSSSRLTTGLLNPLCSWVVACWVRTNPLGPLADPHICSQKTQEDEASLCCSPPFSLFPFSFFLLSQSSGLDHFLSVSGASSRHSFRVGVLLTSSLSFPASEKVLFLPRSLEGVFAGSGILGWQFFFPLQHLPCCAISSGHHGF